ncbi:hypothetical protein [Pseudonocardia sp. GCM10023141]|uniref:hypothetical protein n=1 Tax=Pseudonocardia sp. GCM10023141 TaxID=3252653 RepID=UPI00362217B7
MARTSRPRTGTFGRSSRRTGTVEFFTRPESNPVLRVLGFLIRMRAELTLIAVIITAIVMLRPHVGPDATLWIIGGTTAVIVIVPASRRFTQRRLWCVTTRHRIRAAFAQTRTMTHNGRMPFLLWSRPSPVGERVRVWLPAGMSVKDIENVTAELATACWARDVRVHPNRAQAALVIIEIVRRDPLSTSALITPSVIHGLALDPDDFIDDGTVVPLPSRNTVAHPAQAAAPAPTASRSMRKNAGSTAPSTASTNPEPPAVAGLGGVDVSDYI